MVDRSELEQMLDTMARSGASTLHLMAERVPCLRLQGKLVRSQGGKASDADLWALVGEILSTDQRDRLLAGDEIECLYTSQAGVRFRAAFIRDSEGLNAVFRRMPRDMPTLAELGLPELVNSFAHFNSGLVLVTGFLGSGKSMTLAALIDRVNRTTASHIVTIEQPIEIVHEAASSMVHQREVGRQVRSFSAGIREAVRQSADVIMVGELRDAATLLAVLDAAERGALVLAGFQASGVVGALDEIAALCFGSEVDRVLQRLSSVLRVLVSQTLLQRAHSQGRVPVLEILINNQAVTKAIGSRNFQELPKIMERSRGLGMQTVDQGLKDLLGCNLIALDEALYHATDREWIYQRVRA